MKLKLFHIVYKGGKLPKLNEKLDLDDEIEDGDYEELSNGNMNINFNFVRELNESTSFHLKHKNDIDNFYREFLVITNASYKIIGFIRI
jgi:hypothetical protein